MSTKKEPITEGRMQIKLEAAQESINSLSYNLTLIEKQHGEALTKEARYYLQGIENYVNEVLRAMQARWGSTEGQLCPYDDCVHDLAFSREGWWRCPNCQGVFFAHSSDGIEDFHCYPVGHRRAPVDVPPAQEIPTARDLGPSYATPGGRT